MLIYQVADFGLSRRTDTSENDIDGAEYYRSDSAVFAVRWTAPEAMNSGVFTEASDVWSFGK